MIEYFIHSPIFCCILGGITVPLLQHIEQRDYLGESNLPGFDLNNLITSILLHVSIAAIAGFILFDTYAMELKATYFYTGAASPLLFNRMLYIRRDSTNKTGKQQREALYKVME